MGDVVVTREDREAAERLIGNTNDFPAWLADDLRDAIATMRAQLRAERDAVERKNLLLARLVLNSAEYRNAMARKYANEKMVDAKEHALELIAILDGKEEGV